jgi:hypothetical protein
MDWFLVIIRVMKRCGRLWAWLLGNSFTKEDMAQSFACLELVRGCFLDSFCGRSEVVGCLEDTIYGRYFRDGNGMVFVTECVRDMFATNVAHDDLDASIMLEQRADVPRVQCMKTS